MDVCEPFKVTSLGGSKYYVRFIESFSRRNFIYTIKNKREVLSKYKIFKLQVEKQTGRRIKALRSDKGPEYASNEILEAEGISRQLTVPYTSQQNGDAKRKAKVI